ncbi:lysostaphin resistance A-like protein [Mangrovibacterium sp.]|uniref:CPBP family intramembrane glutamic endopeptidase n=1 Tax=Mangrovibacterium sp. TaxID=1961364 RepID=UPI003564CA2C
MEKGVSRKEKGWQRVLLIMIPFLVVSGTFELIGAWLIDSPIWVESNLSDWQRLVVTTMGMIGTIVVVILFSRFVDRANFEAYKFEREVVFKEWLFSGILLFLCFSGGYVVVLELDQLEFVSLYFDGMGFVQTVVLFFVVAIGEEVFCRAYILKNLAESFGMINGLIFSSLIFCALHAFNPGVTWVGVMNIFLAGIFLGLAYLIRENVWLPISIHFFWNLIQCHFGFLVSGMDSYSLVQNKIDDASIWNGGDFGFEGSLLCTLLQVILIGVFGLLVKKNKFPDGAGLCPVSCLEKR